MLVEWYNSATKGKSSQETSVELHWNLIHFTRMNAQVEFVVDRKG